MALHFVSTAVLTAKDGISYEQSEEVKTKAHLANSNNINSGANKSLFQQLAEQQEAKDEIYNANTKLIFGELQHMERMNKYMMDGYIHTCHLLMNI